MMVWGGLVFAQNQKYTMAEAVNGLRSNLAVKNIAQPSWIPGKNTWVKADKNAYIYNDLATKKSDTLVSLHQINKNFTKEKALKRMPFVTFLSDNSGF